jgi:symplekin
MEKAAADEKARRANAVLGDSRKRPLSPALGEPTDAKRPKLNSNAVASTSASFLATFDFTTLPANLITELIVANLEAFTEPTLIDLVRAFRESRGLATSSVPVAPAPKAVPPHIERDSRDGERTPTPQGRQATPVPAPGTPPSKAKEEPVDPLQMDIDQDELEYEPERLNQEVRPIFALKLILAQICALKFQLSGDVGLASSAVEIDPATINLQLIDFKIPPPSDLVEDERMRLIEGAVKRIWDGAEDFKTNVESIPVDSTQAGGHAATEMWMLLMVRMVTRVAEPPSIPVDGDDAMEGSALSRTADDFYARQDQLRQILCDYIMADFPARYVRHCCSQNLLTDNRCQGCVSPRRG